MSRSHPTSTFRASRGGYVGFGIIFAYAIGMMAVIITHDPRPGSWLVLLLVAAAACFVWAWLRAFRLEISETALVYTTLRTRRVVGLEQIQSVDLSVEPFASPTGPTVRLTLSLNSDEEPLIINAKVFDKSAVRAVFALAPGADRGGLLTRGVLRD